MACHLTSAHRWANQQPSLSCSRHIERHRDQFNRPINSPYSCAQDALKHKGPRVSKSCNEQLILAFLAPAGSHSHALLGMHVDRMVFFLDAIHEHNVQELTWAFSQALGSGPALRVLYRLNSRMDLTASPTASWDAFCVSHPSSTLAKWSCPYTLQVLYLLFQTRYTPVRSTRDCKQAHVRLFESMN